jgi:hypothetical protein
LRDGLAEGCGSLLNALIEFTIDPSEFVAGVAKFHLCVFMVGKLPLQGLVEVCVIDRDAGLGGDAEDEILLILREEVRVRMTKEQAAGNVSGAGNNGNSQVAPERRERWATSVCSMRTSEIRTAFFSSNAEVSLGEKRCWRSDSRASAGTGEEAQHSTEVPEGPTAV